MEDIIILIN